MNSIEIDLRPQHRRPAHVARDRDIDRSVVDGHGIEALECLLDAGHQLEIGRRLRRCGLLLPLPFGFRLLSPEGLELPPLLIESLLFAGGRIIALPEGRADVFGDVFDFLFDLCDRLAACDRRQYEYRNELLHEIVSKQRLCHTNTRP